MVVRVKKRLEINTDGDLVWKALVHETDAWWLAEFRMVGEGSKVAFDARAGGHLIEEHENGGSLLWYVVQWISPAERRVYLHGHVAPDWGGPSSNILKLSVEERGDGAVLEVSDAHCGFISDETIASLEAGWKQLFRDGLKSFVESSS